MNYQQALRYMYEKLPMFHRVGVKAYKKDLSRTLALCSRLGDPQRRLKCIHVAGTNGKGSTAAYLTALLRGAGHRVGTFTSPHLLRYNERVRISREAVDDASLVRAFHAIESARQQAGVSLTYFEMGTLAAAWLFGGRANSGKCVTRTSPSGSQTTPKPTSPKKPRRGRPRSMH